MSYKTVLFDLDHTLLDSDESERLAFDVALTASGVADPSSHLALYQSINKALWSQVESGQINVREVRNRRFEQLVERAKLDASPHRLADDYVVGLGANGNLYPGARELLDELSGLVQLGLITNGFGSVQRARIERLNLGPVFEAITISGEVGVSKPRVEIFEHLFAQFGGVDPSSTVIVGDSLSSDIQGGTNCGIGTCWFNPRGKPAGTPTPTHEVDCLDAISTVVLAT